MSLPVVSMEDSELFSKNKPLEISKPLQPLSIEEFEKVSLNKFHSFRSNEDPQKKLIVDYLSYRKFRMTFGGRV